MNDRVISLLGLAARAGKVASGGFAVEKAVKEGRAYLVILAGDASQRSAKTFRDMCSYYRVPIAAYADKDLLGHGIGKEERTAAAVLDEGFAKALRKLLDSNEERGR